MKAFLPRLIITALSLGVAEHVLAGIYVDDFTTLVIAAFLLGIVNAVVRPVLVILTLPITILTLGLFLPVLNGAMLCLVAWLLPGFSIHGPVSAILGWLIISIISLLATILFGAGKQSSER